MSKFEIVGLTQAEATRCMEAIAGAVVWDRGHAFASGTLFARPMDCQCGYCTFDHIGNVNEMGDGAETAGTFPVAKLTVRDGSLVRASLYAPGLPDGEHDVFPVPLDLRGKLRRSIFAAREEEEPAG